MAWWLVVLVCTIVLLLVLAVYALSRAMQQRDKDGY
jgi:hypothetical protein